jgi:peroxiredoxin
MLKADPGATESAERLFVLAAIKGAADIEELTNISRVSQDSDLKERARKLSVVTGAAGKPYEQLGALGAPLPDLSHFVGKPVVIVFWAASDRRFLEQWHRLRSELEVLKRSGVEIVGVNFDPAEQEQFAATFVKNEGLKWASIYRKDKPFSHSVDYCAQSLPWFWLIDEKGEVVSTDLRRSTLLVEVTSVLKNVRN